MCNEGLVKSVLVGGPLDCPRAEGGRVVQVRAHGGQRPHAVHGVRPRRSLHRGLQ